MMRCSVVSVIYWVEIEMKKYRYTILIIVMVAIIVAGLFTLRLSTKPRKQNDHSSEIKNKIHLLIQEQGFEKATEWTLTISNRDTRVASVGTAVQLWAEKDPEAATAWVGKLPRNDVAAYGWVSIVAQTWGKKDPMAAIQWASNLANIPVREGGMFIANVSTAWARNKPEAAIQWVLQLPKVWFRKEALCGVIVALAESDPKRASQLVGELPTEYDEMFGNPEMSTKSEMQWLVAKSWVNKDSLAAAEWAFHLPDIAHYNDGRTSALLSIVQTWARKNPLDAAKWVAKLPEGKDRRSLITPVFSVWAETQPTVAAKWADHFLAGEERTEVLGSIVDSWSAKDPKAALQLARKLPDGIRKTRALGSVAVGLASKDPQSALALAGEIPPGELWQEWHAAILAGTWPPGDLWQDAMSGVVQTWAKKSPLDAAQWVAQFPPGDHWKEVWFRLVLNWVKNNDKTSAIHFVAQLSNIDDRNRLLTGLAWGLQHSDPETASQFALQLPEGSERDNALAWIAIDLLAINKNDAVVGFVYQIKEKIKRDWIFFNISQSLVKKDPRAAAQWVCQITNDSEHPSPHDAVNDIRNRALFNLANIWTQKDPTNAAQWAVNLPEEDERKVAVRIVEKVWGAQDIKAVAQWMSQLPESLCDKEVFLEVAADLHRSDSLFAFRWITNLPHKDLRLIVLSEFIKTSSKLYFGAGALYSAIRDIHQLPEGDSRNLALSIALQQLIESGPSFTVADEVLYEVKTLPQATRIEIINKLISLWSKTNPAEAANWVRQIDAVYKNTVWR